MIPREARREARREAPSREVCNLVAREARMYHTRIARPSSLVGVRLDVVQSSDVKAHYGFPGNRLPSTTKLWVLFFHL